MHARRLLVSVNAFVAERKIHVVAVCAASRALPCVRSVEIASKFQNPGRSDRSISSRSTARRTTNSEPSNPAPGRRGVPTSASLASDERSGSWLGLGGSPRANPAPGSRRRTGPGRVRGWWDRRSPWLHGGSKLHKKRGMEFRNSRREFPNSDPGSERSPLPPHHTEHPYTIETLPRPPPLLPPPHIIVITTSSPYRPTASASAASASMIASSTWFPPVSFSLSSPST